VRNDPLPQQGQVFCLVTFIFPYSTQHGYTVFFKPFIGRNNLKATLFGGGDDKSVARVLVDGWELGGGDADIQFKREDSESMVLDSAFKPLLRRAGQVKLSFGYLGERFQIR
jgi:hypothetical protein